MPYRPAKAPRAPKVDNRPRFECFQIQFPINNQDWMHYAAFIHEAQALEQLRRLRASSPGDYLQHRIVKHNLPSDMINGEVWCCAA